MSSPHSAAGSAAGYVHQIQLGLLWLWDRTGANPNVSVSLEALDDVAMADGVDVDSLIQVKHSVDPEAVLADRDVALWRTLGIWMDRQAAGDELPELVLCTTHTCVPDSAVAALRPAEAGRDEASALRMLRDVAAERPGNKQTLKVREQFVQLRDDDAGALLSAISVLDGTAQVDAFDEELRKRVGMHAPTPESVPTFVSQLRGWWMQRAADMLVENAPSVTGHELWACVREAHEQLGGPQLSLDAQLFASSPGDEEGASLYDQVFVRQIRLVVDSNDVCDVAVRDYWRVQAQRSKWQRDGDVTPGELPAFDRRLVDEWAASRANALATLDSTSDEAAKRRAGFGLYTEMQKSGIRVRPEFYEPVVTRGSLHGLAQAKDIGWHPEYRDRLGEA